MPTHRKSWRASALLEEHALMDHGTRQPRNPRTPQDGPKRPEMTRKRRAAIHAAHGGLCELCGMSVALDQCEIDHRIAWWISRDDSDDNLRPLCTRCHRTQKTPSDAPVIAHIKRIHARINGTRRDRPKIRSAGFQKGKRPIPSRPFPKRP